MRVPRSRCTPRPRRGSSPRATPSSRRRPRPDEPDAAGHAAEADDAAVAPRSHPGSKRRYKEVVSHSRGPPFPDAIGMIVAPWRRLLVDHDFALGCPLAATVVDAVDNEELRGHVSKLLARWQTSVAEVYINFGDPPAAADERSTVLLAALEGASSSPALGAAPSRSTQWRATSRREPHTRLYRWTFWNVLWGVSLAAGRAFVPGSGRGVWVRLAGL